jgi:phosphoribosylaminoimidazole-succinocarboxamide synthase
MVEQGFSFYDISAEDMSEDFPDLRSHILAAYDELRSEVDEKGLEVPPPKLELGLENILFVCDIPTITPDKEEKLSEIVNKILSKVLGDT